MTLPADCKMAAREEFLRTVKRNPFALEYASAELKGDREFIKEAVKQNATALYHLSLIHI